MRQDVARVQKPVIRQPPLTAPIAGQSASIIPPHSVGRALEALLAGPGHVLDRELGADVVDQQVEVAAVDVDADAALEDRGEDGVRRWNDGFLAEDLEQGGVAGGVGFVGGVQGVADRRLVEPGGEGILVRMVSAIVANVVDAEARMMGKGGGGWVSSWGISMG